MNALVRILSLPAVALSKVPGFGPLIRACSTSVGQKIVMAITGLSLCGFLVMHLLGNLNLFAGEEKFNHYAETLHSLGPLLAAAEVGLFATFLAHIGLALSTAAMNRTARGGSYLMKESKQPPFALPSGGASNWMMLTGGVIFLFLVLHIVDMKLKVDPLVDYTPAVVVDDAGSASHGDGHMNEFIVVRQVLRSPVNAVAYFIALIALGVHLSHGFRSALQTLGVNHRRWNSLLTCISVLFAWAIAVGFISLIVWAFAAPQ
ncbi:MAG: succinate dehydrogenase cytochrome b subunit [Planctomycetaceae bacterium]